jgi:nucleoid DNA-binding protein
VFDSIAENLAKGQLVRIEGFGSFTVKQYKGSTRAGCLQGGIPAHGQAVFKPSDKLRKAVWSIKA